MKIDNNKFLSSNFGMEMYSPMHHFIINKIIVDTKDSKLEERRKRLIYKMKEKRAVINKILLVALTIVLSIITTSFCLLILSKFDAQIIAIEIGIFIPLTWVGIYVSLSSHIETDANFIRIKRKGKIY